MAHFYGTVHGGRGKTSRLGHKTTGMRTVAASYSGGVHVHLYVHQDGHDHALICLEPHKGAGVSRVLYDGPVSGAPVVECVTAR